MCDAAPTEFSFVCIIFLEQWETSFTLGLWNNKDQVKKRALLNDTGRSV
jgi:hypothetical protein